MIRERDNVIAKGRKGVVMALLDWREGKPHAVAVRHNDDVIYKNEEVVYKIGSVESVV